jgi:ATP-dependent exoDNAse (exonuclease V) alpha subunit
MQMTEAGFPQPQTAGGRTDQGRCQVAEIRLVPHQKAATAKLGHQGAMVAAGLEARLEFQLGRHVGLHRQLGRLQGPAVGAAEQAVRLKAQAAQPPHHGQGALLTHPGQGPLRIIRPLNALRGDAMTQQIEINRG